MLEIYCVLRDLREGRGITQAELAVEMGVSRDTIARIETGAQKVTVDYLLKFGAAMKVHPVDILRRMEENDRPFVYLFRAHGSRYFTDDIRMRYESWYNRMEDLNVHANLSRLRNIPLKDYGIADGDSPSAQGLQTARWLREKWRLGSGPISDPVDLLESLGYYITGIDLGENDIFAVTGRKGSDGRPGIVINVNPGITVERQRFSIIHELGHIVEHGEEFEEQPDYSGYGRNKDTREKFADAFAAEFLIPANELIVMYEKMANHTLEEKIIVLKRYFKVSYQALMIRLFDTGLLNMEESEFWQYYGKWKRYYGKSEPVPIIQKLEFNQEQELRALIRKSDSSGKDGVDSINPDEKSSQRPRITFANPN